MLSLISLKDRLRIEDWMGFDGNFEGFILGGTTMTLLHKAKDQSDVSVAWTETLRAPAHGRTALAVDLRCAPLTIFERVIKRTLDVAFAMATLLILSPLFFIIAIAIKLDSEGPVIFRQRRSGLNAKQFIIYKFRTMTVLEDGPTVNQACRDDLRVTCVGRFLRRSSLDELPQLLNVLMGDMSLVGPRPHALVHDHEYKTRIANYAFRYRVKPGMTGWAQVNGLRGETRRLAQMAERVQLDLRYIDHWSLSSDLIILLRTCFEVVRNRAY
jgi:putative colanic acid biosysnthesis UDP-glucose lipid carrier transferase